MFVYVVFVFLFVRVWFCVFVCVNVFLLWLYRIYHNFVVWVFFCVCVCLDVCVHGVCV